LQVDFRLYLERFRVNLICRLADPKCSQPHTPPNQSKTGS
jgi:hypothetical protein